MCLKFVERNEILQLALRGCFVYKVSRFAMLTRLRKLVPLSRFTV